MTRYEHPTSQQIERLMAGRVDENDPDLGSLARAVADLRTAYTFEPSSELRSSHLDAMSAVFQHGSHAPARYRRRRLGIIFRVAGAAAALVLTTGSALAVGGVLPDAAQNSVADAVGNIGLDLPGGSDDTPRTTPAPAGEGKAKAEANRTEAESFTDAKKTWTECVADAAPAHPGPGPFDPEAACGPKPQPSPVQSDQPAADSDAPDEHPGKGPPDEPGQRGVSNGTPPSSPGPPAHAKSARGR